MRMQLKYPLTVGTKLLDALNFRDAPMAEDYLAFDTRGGVAQNHALIAALSGTEVEIVKRLHAVDYRRAVRLTDKLFDRVESELDEDEFAELDPPKKPSGSSSPQAS